MLTDEYLSNIIQTLRPLIRSKITKFLVVPEFYGTATRIVYDLAGRRSVYWRDLNQWQEYRFIDTNTEDALSYSGYPVIQSVSKVPVTNCEVHGIVLPRSHRFIAYTVQHVKYTELSPIDALYSLPDQAHSVLPFMIPVDFSSITPDEARVRIKEIYHTMCRILSQEIAPPIFRGSRAKVLNKHVTHYPKIHTHDLKSLLFVQDKREL